MLVHQPPNSLNYDDGNITRLLSAVLSTGSNITDLGDLKVDWNSSTFPRNTHPSQLVKLSLLHKIACANATLDIILYIPVIHGVATFAPLPALTIGLFASS